MDGQCLVSIFKRLGFEIALYHGDVSLEEGKSHLMFEGQYFHLILLFNSQAPGLPRTAISFFFAK